MPDDADPQELLKWTSEIVAAHVRNSSMNIADLPSLIQSVHGALRGISGGEDLSKQEPAVPIKRSITPDFIVCLEDGMKLKMLKRHLSTSYNMTPDEYREKWELPSDYPMVAPNYARQRSTLAKKIGLGKRRG